MLGSSMQIRIADPLLMFILAKRQMSPFDRSVVRSDMQPHSRTRIMFGVGVNIFFFSFFIQYLEGIPPKMSDDCVGHVHMVVENQQ